MARTFDPLRHQARRMVIIDAALTCFAAEGFHRTTTAAICRTAGIGSGTFFHYFPTKLSVLLGVLDVGTAESAAWFAAQAGRTDPARVIEDYVAHVADECADPRVAGFVRAVTAVLTEPDVVMALARDEAVVREGLLPWIRAAQEARQVRTDLAPAQLCTWITIVLDGFLGRVAADSAFAAGAVGAEGAVLADTVRRLLAP
jgi:AcrR family transcriptional regulator